MVTERKRLERLAAKAERQLSVEAARQRHCRECGAMPGEPCYETAGVRAGRMRRMHEVRYRAPDGP